MKLFPEIVRSLYDENVLAEDTIHLWFHKGANPKGRYIQIATSYIHGLDNLLGSVELNDGLHQTRIIHIGRLLSI